MRFSPPEKIVSPRRNAAPDSPDATTRSRKVRLVSIRDHEASSDADDVALVSLVTLKAVLSAAQDSAPNAHIPGLPGVSLRTIVDPTIAVARAEFGRLLQQIADETRDEAVGLTLGKSLSSAQFHVAGPLVMSNVTARQALLSFLMLRRRMLGGPAWQLTVAHGEASFGHPLGDFNGAKVEADFGIAIAYNAALCFWGPRIQGALRVEFAYRQPPDRARYDALFDGRVRFGAERNSMIFPEELLDRERLGGDSKLATELAGFVLKSYLQSEQAQRWSRAVRLALVSAPSLRTVDSQSLAAEFNLTARTLRRRLEREGISFRKLLEEVRLERARQLLETTAEDIGTISVALGYKEVNAFRRAFRAWSGRSPSSFRKSG